MLNPRQVITALKQNIGKVIVGKDEVIELLLVAMMCKGHVLIEDVPGTGKTTLASALAKSLDCSFNRIQFTPDVVPSDITGFTMVNMKTGEMEFQCHTTISFFVVPFSSCLQSFPASGSFSMSQFFASGGRSIGASASVLPMNVQD